ncbi:VanZ family protein [Nocardioides cynanchi]|uniref:VanZ family protein n=1 Tax=Nocardioides cynanchi TaxID=2558918 RepID=UPI00124713FA|nr:VanZ family protein [Nocardioides cynanchi]
MVPIGGTTWMLLLAAAAGCCCLVVALAVGRRMGPVAGTAWGGLLWSIVVIGLVTLLPPVDHPGIVPASQHQTSCSWDIGGPSPGGFWIFGGGQQLLNALLFVPAGLLMTVAFSRWRAGRLLVPIGFLLLASYSLGIEEIQLHVARIDRACDVTDIIDNVAGAGIGVLLGLVLLPVLRPWRGRGRGAARLSP